MSKRGLPAGVQMRHDFHYVEELNVANRPVGKIIPIGSIEPNPEQPRSDFGDLTDLTESIREKGVLEPLLVKPKGDGRFMIVAGERRWRASNLAGLEEVPCIELDLDDKGVAEIALIENLQRKDLTIWEEADGLKALGEKFGYTQDQIAKKISKSRTTVTELMTVAGIPGEIREKCRASNISSKSTLLEIARQFDDAAMLKFVEQLGDESTNRDTLLKAAKAERLPLKKNDGPGTNGAAVNTFHYKAPNGDFVISLKFTESGDVTKASVLNALKDAFDQVKNGQTAL
ncbi:MAG: ParB/RepB/Spo0J family partition protein [Pyrinomonadaceae bacterium]